MSQFMVGRQPIFDANLGVRGYELLFRDPSSRDLNGDAMTADVLVRAGLDVGLSSLVGGKLAFVNATRAFLVGEHEFPFPARQTVVEVLEDVAHDPEVVSGCRRLARSGYTLALDDYVWEEDDDPLLELVSIVKLDVLKLTPAQLAHAVERRCAFGVQLVAEKVETRQQFDACRQLGFDLYQGYLLSRPEIVEGQALSPRKLTCLRIIDKLCDPDTSAGEIETIVQSDVALSYRFLRVAGAGAAQGLFRRLSSVRDAVVLLGQRRLRAWVTLMLLDGAQEGSNERLSIAMTRARMAELMAEPLGARLADSAYTVGLVSALDLLLHAPLPQIIEGLSLSSELEDALLGQTGVLGGVLADVRAWEVGGESFQGCSGTRPAELERCYVQALAWANEVCGVLSRAEAQVRGLAG
ncbi:MAG: EAL domain-containing protein [Acidimicrobiales bacterium]|jgi:EAL and modified HD-GYP domain-containing signal transduction protein